MSRRESRDSDPKRQSSRVDRESSPKRSRRDGKPEAERVLSKNDLDARDGTEADKKPHRHLRDAAPLESGTHALSKEAEKKNHGHQERTKGSPSRSEAPRSRPYYQHDEHGGAGKGDRRAPAERGWWRSSRDQIHRRASDGDRSQHRRDKDETMWRHDKFQENKDNPAQTARKRPAVREKIAEEPGNADRTEPEQGKDNHHDRSIDLMSERRSERNTRSNWRSERHERPPMGRDRMWNRGERFGERGAGNRQSYGGNRDRFDNRRGGGFRGIGSREEKKWEHDMFDEANKSPPRKNEEEQMAKLEALLAS